ncbi:MAG: beta strand repeat-containing protein, partial [Candidatus Heimdallarchaeota archaeon]
GNIVGGSNVDTFNISGSSTITGSIKGGQGNDVINLTLTGAETGGFTFIGEQGADDKIIMNGGNVNYIATYTPDVLNSGNDQFIYDNAGNSYSINYDIASTEVIENNLTANSLTINGTSSDDIISLDASAFKVNDSLAVDFTYSNNANLIFDGLIGGVDIIELIADVGSTAMNLEFSNAEVIGNANTLFADNLMFSNASAGTNSSQRLVTDITSLSITDSGPIYLSDISNNLDIAQLSTADIVDVYLTVGDVSNSSNLVSSAAFLANAENGNISITGQNQLSGPITLLAANGTIILENDSSTILDDITTTDLTLNIFNSNSTTQSASGIIDANVITLNSTGDFVLGNDNLLNNITVSNSNDININNLNLSNIISVNALGDVNMTSNGISLSSISANSISLDAGNAAITDNNGGNINLVANTVSLIATGGIGSISNAIDTQITGIDKPGELTAINKVGGDISISNVGNVLLRKVSNLDGNGDIRFDNIGDLTIDTLETITSYTDNGTERIDLNITNGSVYGAETTVDGDTKPFYTSQSDIRAHSISFLMDGENSIGTGSRPLSVEVPDTVEILLSTQNFIYFYGTEPDNFIGENDLSNQIFDLINNLAGQQLIEVESLAQIDPAIFTDVRNYSHSDNPIMMPVDQRYDDLEEENLLKHNQ